MDQPAIGIVFGDGIDETRRRRLTHAGRSVAAVWGLRWDDHEPMVRLCYGIAPSRHGDVAMNVSEARLDPGTCHRPELFLDNEATGYVRLRATDDGQPDWLADIFEWLGAEVEVKSGTDDDIGAIPFEATLCGRFGLDPEVPWAAVAMRGLEADIAAAVPGWVRDPPAGDRPIVAATHDLDFLPIDRLGRIRRSIKNAAIAILIQRSGRLALSNARGLVTWPTVGELARRELELGIRSSWYVIAAHGHRRDANYLVDDPRVVATMRALVDAGMEIGVHGSYQSVVGQGSLADEYEAVRRLGFDVIGGRQHWLRYRPAPLAEALTDAAAAYDASVGFNGRVGFRAGAPFAFVPWSFRDEAPLPLLELPMAIMDATLFTQDGHDIDASRTRLERVLRRVRLYGPGGISVVWHNTGFGGVQLPTGIGSLYWEVDRSRTRWVSGRTAVQELRGRFDAAGLRLPAV